MLRCFIHFSVQPIKLSISLALPYKVCYVEHTDMNIALVKTSHVETKGHFRAVSSKHPKSGGKMFLSADICVHGALPLFAIFDYR